MAKIAIIFEFDGFCMCHFMMWIFFANFVTKLADNVVAARRWESATRMHYTL